MSDSLDVSENIASGGHPLFCFVAVVVVGVVVLVTLSQFNQWQEFEPCCPNFSSFFFFLNN